MRKEIVTAKVYVDVTFRPEQGYVGRSPDLCAPVVAVSLSGLRRQVESAMLPKEIAVILQLDQVARLERDRRSGR